MELFAGVADWISGHETLLSGMAALIVVAGVVLTALSTGWQRVLGQEAVTLLEDFLPKAARYPTPRIMLGLYLDALGRSDEARTLITRTVRENPGLNVEGLVLMVGAHPDPEQGRARAARLREYWPRAS